MKPPKNSFNTRSFVSLMIAVTLGGLPVTGFANHLHQTEFTVARHAWMSAHNSLGVLFLIFAVWHVVLNRRPLLNHIRGVRARILAPSAELICALGIVTLTTLLAAGHAFLLR